MPVILAQPVIRRRRVSSSSRPIPLKADAQSPYLTTDLHSAECLNQRGLSAMAHRDLTALARKDGKPHRDVHAVSRWTTQNIARGLEVAHG